MTFLRALLIGAVTAGVTSLVLPSGTALVIGGIVVIGLLLPWARVVATVGGLAFIVTGAYHVVRDQQIHHYAPGSDWAGSFVHAGNLIWVGVALLLADGVITAFGLRTKRLRGRRALRAGAGGQAAPGDAGGPDDGEGPGGPGGPEGPDGPGGPEGPDGPGGPEGPDGPAEEAAPDAAHDAADVSDAADGVHTTDQDSTPDEAGSDESKVDEERVPEPATQSLSPSFGL